MEECLFCKIVAGEIPSDKVYEDDNFFAFRDINPQAPVHILIIPKKHIQSLDAVEQENVELIGQLLFKAKEIARAENISEAGYRVVSNIGEEGGQTVNHLHLHIIGGRSMQWPPG